MSAKISSAGDSAPPYAFEASPGLAAWLHAEHLALAISTYQIGKLFLVVGFAQGQINRLITRGHPIAIDDLVAEPA